MLAALADLFIERGSPAHIRSNNPVLSEVEGGSKFAAATVQTLARPDRRGDALHRAGLTVGEPLLREVGFAGLRLNGSLRDALLNGEIFYRLAEARVPIEAWLRHYNTVRPHNSLGFRPPAPEAATAPWPAAGSASRHLCPAMAAERAMH